ncbi:MAG: GIY-YIG nuclease family protein [Sulfuricurvum sp.]|nr:GIY-YIG nuclease family protein [Sulfuricurvum sp.]
MKSSLKAYSLYILKCSDNTYYTGIAVDVEKRLNEHNTSDKGAKYTRSRRPLTLMYTEMCVDKSTALKRELAIKKMKRSDKEALWSCG